MDDRVRISFSLDVDEDGYPPVTVETLWGVTVEGGYKIDNIPFFTRKATIDDIVEVVSSRDGNFWFKRLAISSLSSLIRVVFYDESDREDIEKKLKMLGCSYEYLENLK